MFPGCGELTPGPGLSKRGTRLSLAIHHNGMPPLYTTALCSETRKWHYLKDKTVHCFSGDSEGILQCEPLMDGENNMF